MSIVEELYKKKIDISDKELTEEILKHDTLEVLDLWLLPQYPFDEWRKKHDYPRILKNIKSRINGFEEWMTEFNLTDEILMDGYISSFLDHKAKPNVNTDEFKHIISVSYKGVNKLQVWDSYDGVTSTKGDGEDVLYEYHSKFIPYYDWCDDSVISTKYLIHNIDVYEPNTKGEQVYLNHSTRLLKMGGVRPPVNSLNMLLRGKNLEFINVSGLELKGAIHFGDLGNLEFNHCSVDNLVCSHLDLSNLDFTYCSVRNINVKNSNLQAWMFINCTVTGNIIDSTTHRFKLYSGQFTPNYVNSEIDEFEINANYIPYPKTFDRTYSTLFKAAKNAGNYNLSSDYKIKELDFIRSQKKGIVKTTMWINKIYWGYGYKPYNLLIVMLATIVTFGLFYSLFPCLLGLSAESPYINTLGNSLYYSTITFTTLGYGDISPTGFLKLFASFESLFGAITLGFLVTGLARIRD